MCFKRKKKKNSCLQIFLSALGKYLPCQVYCSVSHSLQTQRLKCQLFPGLHTRQLQNPLFHMCSSADRSIVRRQNLIYIPQPDEMRDLWSCFFVCVCKCTNLHIFRKGKKKKPYLQKVHLTVCRCRGLYIRESISVKTPTLPSLSWCWRFWGYLHKCLYSSLIWDEQ